MTPRPASLIITFLSSDQIYIVIYIVSGEEGSSHQSVWESCAVPEWAAGPPRLELDWSH